MDINKFLLVSRNESEISILQKRIDGYRYEIGHSSFFRSRPNGIKESIKVNPTIIIFNARELNYETREFLMTCRELGYEGPIVILARVPSSALEYQSFENVVILRKPYDQKSLIGIIKNVISSEQVKQRKFPRYPVNENAILEGYENEFRAESKILNISKGGVFVFGNVDSIRRGELVRIHFNLNKINKERTMSAKVAWAGRRGGDETSSAGLEFVSQMTVYNYLLKYAMA